MEGHERQLGGGEDTMPTENSASAGGELRADEMGFKDSSLKRMGLIVVLVVIVLGLLSTVVVVIWSGMAAGVASGGELTIGETASGEIGPSTPVGAAGKPYIDYHLNVTNLSTIRLDLVSENGDNYDPFLSILGDTGNMLTSDDDGGEGLNARLVHEFRPGEYIIRVTSYDDSSPESVVAYHLSATAL